MSSGFCKLCTPTKLTRGWLGYPVNISCTATRLKLFNQTLNDVSRETATRDLKQLIDKQLIIPSGQKGTGAFYTLN